MSKKWLWPPCLLTVMTLVACGGGGPPDVSGEVPSAQEMIQDARDQGRIDYGTSLLYRAYALFGDIRLPEAYWGGGSLGEDPGLFVEFEAAKASLPTDTLAQLEPYFLRPNDPRSIFSSPVKVQVKPAQADAAFCDTSNWASRHSVTYPVRVWVRCTGLETDPELTEMLNETMEILDKLWGPMTGLMGPPIPDTPGATGREDESIDFYLVDPLDVLAERRGEVDDPAITKGALAVARSTAPYDGVTSSGYVVLSKTKFTEDRVGFRMTLIHEFFHILQNKHNEKIAFRKEGENWREYWFVEASAEWAAAHFDRTIRWERRAALWSVHSLFRDFQGATESLHISTDPLTEDGLLMYAAYVWPFFMEQEKGEKAIGDAWRAINGVTGLDWAQADAAIGAQLSFETNFHEFAVRNFNRELDGENPIGKRYQELDDLFPSPDNQYEAQEWASPPMAEMEMLEPQDRDAPPLSYDVGGKLPALRAYYANFEVGGDVQQLVFDFSELEPAAGFDVDMLLKIRDQGWERRSWSDTAKITFCKHTDDIEEIYLVLSNHQLERDADVTGAYEATALEEPCTCGEIAAVEAWSGRAAFSYSIVADDGVQRIEEDLSATLNGELQFDMDGVAATAWGSPSGNGQISSSSYFHTDEGPMLVGNVQGNGAPLPYTPPDGSRIFINFDLEDCLYNVFVRVDITATSTASGGSEEVVTEIGAFASGSMPIPESLALSGEGSFPAHSQSYIVTSTEVGNWFSSSGADGASYLVGEDGLGFADVTWSFGPAAPTAGP